jgi:hypothetical protein
MSWEGMATLATEEFLISPVATLRKMNISN